MKIIQYKEISYLEISLTNIISQMLIACNSFFLHIFTEHDLMTTTLLYVFSFYCNLSFISAEPFHLISLSLQSTLSISIYLYLFLSLSLSLSLSLYIYIYIYIYVPLHMDAPVLADQLELTSALYGHWM